MNYASFASNRNMVIIYRRSKVLVLGNLNDPCRLAADNCSCEREGWRR